MQKLADISVFESLSKAPCGAVFNNAPCGGILPHLADISLFENIAVYNIASIPMTRDGYNRLRDELDRLENEEMPKVRDQIAAARAEGDLKENAEYHAAREKQGLLQAKINELKDRLSRAEIIEADDVPHDEVRFGATVTVTRADTGDQKVYTLVGFGDDDPAAGRISVTSPLAKAFLGAKKGEDVVFTTPSGKQRTYHIDDISYGESGSAEEESDDDIASLFSDSE